MNIVIPMAGIGKRMRPHTLTIPKPLLPIAGKPIVEHLVKDIVNVCGEPVNEIGFIIGDFGAEVEKKLLGIAETLGAKGRIYYQEEALGTAHAILCAKELLAEKTVVAFADTLFKANFTLDVEKDSIIWVQKVEDPSAYGVVELNEGNQIVNFVEKPKQFVSDLAIIGIYYFKDGKRLRQELEYLIENDIKDNGEYQITDALRNWQQNGGKFYPGAVDEWLDCGNKNAMVNTHQQYLGYLNASELVAENAVLENACIVPPVYIGSGAEIKNSVVGPFVSVGENTKIHNSCIQNSIIQTESLIQNANIANSMLGNFVTYKQQQKDVSIGDYNVFKE